MPHLQWKQNQTFIGDNYLLLETVNGKQSFFCHIQVDKNTWQNRMVVFRLVMEVKSSILMLQ